MFITYEMTDLANAARQFWQYAGDATVFAFHGEMGAGKTTFIHALCDVKGVADVVGSPTFSIVNEYIFEEDHQTRKIFHIDLYRLNSEEEALHAGIGDCLYSDHICLVEWPEKAPGIFPEDTVHVFLEVTGEQRRKLRIGGN